MTQVVTCPQCSAIIPPDAPGGVCPACVMQLAGGDGAGWNQTSVYSQTPTLPTLTELAALFPQLEILELIGRGGMGAVYKARQPSLDRFVALKILLPDIGKDPTFAERFNREARALAKLNHPHIVSVYDSGHVGGLYYFVMEYVDGVNLRQAIQAEQISPEKALAIVPQICDALQYAHEEGVVHRDIKPENVLLDRKGRVKVADFGLAKLLGLATPDITLTGTRQAMGTLHYMAPEQYERPQAVDHRADIYSLGVVFYELLTGKLPLGRFALPSEKVSIDARLDDVVLKSLEREPERRYQYVSEVKTEVDSIAHSPAQQRPMPTVLAAGRGMHAPPPRNEYFAPAPPTARPQELTNAGRLMLVLGVLALAVWPLLCGAGLIPPMFGVSMELTRIGLIVGTPLLLVGGAILIAVGLLSKRPVLETNGIPQEKLSPLTTTEREKAERSVRAAGLALLILGILNMAFCVFVAALVFGQRSIEQTPIVLLVLHLGISLFLMVAAAQMRSMKSYGLAMAGAILAMLPIHAGVIPGIFIGIWALVVLSQRDVRKAFGIQDRPAAPDARRKSATPMVALVLLIVGGIVVLPALLAVGLMLSWTSVRVETPSTTVMKTSAETEPPKVDPTIIHWTKEGPVLGEGVSLFGHLSPEQEHAVQSALSKVYADYLKLEQAHTQHTKNPAGHQVVTISPFDLTKLEDKFWTEVDEVLLNDAQRRELRGQLTSKVLFPFGHQQVSYEFWKVGKWYHYANAYNHFDGPQLPPQLARFWRPPLEEESTNETAPTDQ